MRHLKDFRGVIRIHINIVRSRWEGIVMIPARPLFLLFALATLAVAACAPLPYEYLKPSVPGAEYTRSECGESVGPKDRVVLHGPEDLTIRVSGFLLEELSYVQQFENRIATKHKQGQKQPYPSIAYETGIGIAIILQIPQSTSVQFLSKSFLLMDEGAQAVYEYQAEHLFLFPEAIVKLGALTAALGSQRTGDGQLKRRISFSESLTAVPPKEGWFGLTTDRPYYIVLLFGNIEDARSGRFRLRIPPLSVGAMTYEFPEISFRFVKEWKWDWLVINC